MGTKRLIQMGVICESVALMMALNCSDKYDREWDKACEKATSEGRDFGFKDIYKVLMKTFYPMWVIHGAGCWALGKAIKKS